MPKRIHLFAGILSPLLTAPSSRRPYRSNCLGRMPFIAADGLLVLVPCAIFLSRLAFPDLIDTTFYSVQALELLAEPTNVTLLALNARDGLRLAG